MRSLILFFMVLGLSASVSSCCSAKKSGKADDSLKIEVSSPEVIIYKTNKDYSTLVPVLLSKDKTTIESYPDVKDVFYKGKLAYPTLLHNDYLLDNRGINENAAFLRITYEEYSKLDKTPSAEELRNMILDDNPILEMYRCGTKTSYKEIEKELNAKIDAGDFSGFVKMK
jgi:hypothetical protein